MENKKRIERIEEIQKLIYPLNYKKIFLETSLYFEKEKYFKDYNDSTKEKISSIEKELGNVLKELEPNLKELDSLKCKYAIEYEGYVFDSNAGKNIWLREHGLFNFNTCCDIDTYSYGWDFYLSNECVNDLTTEIFDYINLKYSKFKLLNIKRIIPN